MHHTPHPLMRWLGVTGQLDKGLSSTCIQVKWSISFFIKYIYKRWHLKQRMYFVSSSNSGVLIKIILYYFNSLLTFKHSNLLLKPRVRTNERQLYSQENNLHSQNCFTLIIPFVCPMKRFQPGLPSYSNYNATWKNMINSHEDIFYFYIQPLFTFHIWFFSNGTFQYTCYTKQ